MHRGSLLPSMGGLPRRVPPSPAIAFLVTPPPQIGPPTHGGAGGGGSKKQLGVSPASGGNLKCSRCKARPKSGSGSSLCIRCKLQRDYGSPRGGFAGPRKRTPMGGLPLIALSSSLPVTSASVPVETSRNDGPNTPQAACIPSQAYAGLPGSLERPGPLFSLGQSASTSVGELSTLRTETSSGGQEPLDKKALIVRLEVDGDVSRNVEWATLRDRQDLTETAWPQLMDELEGETDDFRPEPLNQVVPTVYPSQLMPDQAESCRANVSIPAELMGAINANNGSGRPRLGFSRPPAIISLPEAPESPPEFRAEPASDSSPSVLSASVGTISAMGTMNPKLSPTQGVVVTLTIPDAEPEPGMTADHCADSFHRQTVTTSASSTGEAILTNSQQISDTTMSDQQLYLPTIAPTATQETTMPTTMSSGEFAESESIQSDNESGDQQDDEGWRDHVREAVRSYTAYLEEAFSALLESPSETKWVTVLSVFQKKAVLSKILQRLSGLQRAVLSPEEHASVRRISRNVEQLFKAMGQLRGQMVAARTQEQRTEQRNAYPPRQTSSQIYSTPNIVNNSDTNNFARQMSNVCGPCPSSVPSNTTGSSGVNGTSSTTTPQLDVDAFMYPANNLHHQLAPQSTTTTASTTATTAIINGGNSQVYTSAASTGEAYHSSDSSAPLSSPQITRKSLTEEADEEITKILAKLQKEDRSTLPQTIVNANLPSGASAGGSLRPPTASDSFLTNGSHAHVQNSSKTDQLPAGPALIPASSATAIQQHHTTDCGMPTQLMARLLSTEFPAKSSESFLTSLDTSLAQQQQQRHSSTTNLYGGTSMMTPTSTSNESLNGTYHNNIVGRETDIAQSSYDQQQLASTRHQLGNGSLYSEGASKSGLRQQHRDQTSWPGSQQTNVKSEPNGMFEPPPAKKSHIETGGRGGSMPSSIVAPQLRSLLARKLPSATVRETCFMNNSFSDQGKGQPHGLSTPPNPDVFQFSQQQRVYQSPSQGIASYNEANQQRSKMQPTLPAFSSSLQQKSVYQRTCSGPQYGLDTLLINEQQLDCQVDKLPLPLSSGQMVDHQEMMNVGLDVGLQLVQPVQHHVDDIPPNATACSELSRPANSATMVHCPPLSRTDLYDPQARSLPSGSILPSPGYSSWPTV